MSAIGNSNFWTRVFSKAGLDLRIFYIAQPRAAGDFIGEPAHLVAAMIAIVCETISTASSSVGIVILGCATLLRAPALVSSWKQMLGQFWIRALLVWIAWMALSLLWSPDLKMGQYRLGVLVYFIWIPLLWPLNKQWRWLLAAFLFSAIVLQCIQVFGALGETYHGRSLVYGFRHKSMVGLWNAIALSCWVFLSVSVSARAMLLCIPMAILSAVGFIWAGQRAALWGILVEIFIANIALVFAVRSWLRRAVLRAVVALLIIGGAYFCVGEELTVKLKQVQVEISQNFNPEGTGGKSESTPAFNAEVRIAMWRMALIAWQKHPIIGVGYGGYSNATAPIEADVKTVVDIHSFDHPHNTYVMILVENGLVGLVLFLICSGAFFVRAFRMVQLDPLRICAFGGSVVWFAAAIADGFHTREVFLGVGLIMMTMATMPLEDATVPVEPRVD